MKGVGKKQRSRASPDACSNLRPISEIKCVPHLCSCGAQVDAYVVRSLVCKRVAGKITRHQAINDVIAAAFVAADMPVTKEPNDLLIGADKRPDGLTLLPWQEGKPLTWDITVVCSLAVSYVSGYTPGAAAEQVASEKCEKYANLLYSYLFQPIVFKNLGTLNSSAVAPNSSLGRKISTKSNDHLESTFLLQRLTITLQRSLAREFFL